MRPSPSCLSPAHARLARIAALLSLLIAAAPAHAALVELTFSGQVTQILGTPHGQWGTIGLGDPFVVRCVIDSEAEDQVPGSATGLYFYESVSISVGPYTVSAGTGVFNNILVDPPGSPPFWMSEYRMEYYDPDGEWQGLIYLMGPGALQDDSLPIDLDLNAFTALRRMALSFDESNSTIRAVPTAYTFRFLPAPGALALLAIPSLFPRRRRRRRP